MGRPSTGRCRRWRCAPVEGAVRVDVVVVAAEGVELPSQLPQCCRLGLSCEPFPDRLPAAQGVNDVLNSHTASTASRAQGSRRCVALTGSDSGLVSGHMSSRTVVGAPRRQAGRSADTVARLAAAAVDELRAVGYDRLTVRAVARRAGVAPATAYTWFASKDHLVAEAFWRGLEAQPRPRSHPGSPAVSVRAAMDGVGRLVADEPALAAAATSALLASDPDVARLRRRIGRFVHEQLRASLGPASDPEVLAALDLVFAGALLHAGLGSFPYAEFAERMARAARLMTEEAR